MVGSEIGQSATGNGHIATNGHTVAASAAPGPAPLGEASPVAVLAPAALWRRAAARFIDWFAMCWWLFALQILNVTFWVSDYTDTVTPTPWGETFMVITAIAGLYAILEIIYLSKRGQTPAKEMLKIRVVRADGTAPLGWRLAVVRWVLPGLALALPIWIIPIVLALMAVPALFDAQRRTIYDRLAGTVVVPYDAKIVEGPIKNRKALVRNWMDRNVAAVSSKPGLMTDDEEKSITEPRDPRS